VDVGDRDPWLGRLSLAAEGLVDRLAGQADLLGLRPPEVAQALGAEIGVLCLPRRLEELGCIELADTDRSEVRSNTSTAALNE